MNKKIRSLIEKKKTKEDKKMIKKEKNREFHLW